MVASGKVNSDTFTFEKLQTDVVRYGAARYAQYFIIFATISFPDKEIIQAHLENFERFIEEHPEVWDMDLTAILLATLQNRQCPNQI